MDHHHKSYLSPVIWERFRYQRHHCDTNLDVNGNDTKGYGNENNDGRDGIAMSENDMSRISQGSIVGCHCCYVTVNTINSQHSPRVPYIQWAPDDDDIDHSIDGCRKDVVNIVAYQCWKQLQECSSICSSSSSSSTSTVAVDITVVSETISLHDYALQLLSTDVGNSIVHTHANRKNELFIFSLALSSSIEIIIGRILRYCYRLAPLTSLSSSSKQGAIGSFESPGNMLLRQLLSDQLLCLDSSRFPQASQTSIQFLQYLFLPSGINIRNILWHGFLSPIDTVPEHVALLYVLYLTLRLQEIDYENKIQLLMDGTRKRRKEKEMSHGYDHGNDRKDVPIRLISSYSDPSVLSPFYEATGDVAKPFIESVASIVRSFDDLVGVDLKDFDSESIETFRYELKRILSNSTAFYYPSIGAGRDDSNGRVEILVSSFEDIRLLRMINRRIRDTIDCGRDAICGDLLAQRRRIVTLALAKQIPMLEQVLRILFCAVNAHGDLISLPKVNSEGNDHQIGTNPSLSPAAFSKKLYLAQLGKHCCAQDGAYYSTLDGFGQRSKHQLLLDPMLTHVEIPNLSHAENDIEVSDSGEEYVSCTLLNKLPLWLGPGCYSLLVDLFMAAGGPNVRATLAHGDLLKRLFTSPSDLNVNPDTDPDENETPGISFLSPASLRVDAQLCIMTEVILAVLIAIAYKSSAQTVDGHQLMTIVQEIAAMNVLSDGALVDDRFSNASVEHGSGHALVPDYPQKTCSSIDLTGGSSNPFSTAIIPSLIAGVDGYISQYHPASSLLNTFIKSQRSNILTLFMMNSRCLAASMFNAVEIPDAHDGSRDESTVLVSVKLAGTAVEQNSDCKVEHHVIMQATSMYSECIRQFDMIKLLLPRWENLVQMFPDEETSRFDGSIEIYEKLHTLQTMKVIDIPSEVKVSDEASLNPAVALNITRQQETSIIVQICHDLALRLAGACDSKTPLARQYICNLVRFHADTLHSQTTDTATSLGRAGLLLNSTTLSDLFEGRFSILHCGTIPCASGWLSLLQAMSDINDNLGEYLVACECQIRSNVARTNLRRKYITYLLDCTAVVSALSVLVHVAFVVHVVKAIPGLDSRAQVKLEETVLVSETSTATRDRHEPLIDKQRGARLSTRLLNAVVSFGLCVPAKPSASPASSTATVTSNGNTKSIAEKGLAVSTQALLKSMQSRSWRAEFDGLMQN